MGDGCYDIRGTLRVHLFQHMTHQECFLGWQMTTDCDEGLGEFKLILRDEFNHVTFESYMENNLWIHYLKPTPKNV